MPKKENSGSSFNKKRRKLLKLLGLSSAFFAGKSVSAQVRINRATDQRVNANLLPAYISISLLRPEDLLSLELRYYNFSLTNNTLQKKGNPAHLVVIFQPQSMSEQAWKEELNSLETPTVPGKLLIGGESRLVFSIPAGISNIPLDVNELLAWEKYDLAVNDRAKQPSAKLNFVPIQNPKINILKRKTNQPQRKKNIQSSKGLTKDEKLTMNRAIIPDENNSRSDALVRFNANMATLIKDAVGPPDPLETSIEVPMRLYLSPTKIAGWNHQKKLSIDKGIIKETNKLFELWHTRMGTKTKNGIDESELTNEQRILRALWADDADKDYKATVLKKDPDPFLGLTSMNNKDRHRIVHESSNYQIPKFVPQPIKAYKLFLSTLGAWLDSEFLVERKALQDAGVLFGSSGQNANPNRLTIFLPGSGPNDALNLLKWRHIETMGREHYVEIVEAGNIMPFGHEAVLIKITERKPHAGTGTASNFQRQIVVITQPVKDYNYRDGKGEFMNFCYSRVEMITTTSPLLDFNKTKLVNAANMHETEQFVIRSGNQDVLFKIKAEDLDGNFIDFSLPLVFVSTSLLGNASNRNALISAYNSGSNVIKKETNLNGQKFTLAPQASNANDTSYIAHKISFNVKNYVNTDEPQGFLPTLKTAEIVEPSSQRLTGSSNPVTVELVDDKNKGHVFAKFITSNAINFSGQTDKTGGMAAPNFNLSGLSKAAGAFGGDVEKFKTATAAADDFFKEMPSLPDPKIFGVFKLSQILNFVAGDLSSYDLAKPLTDRVPKIPNLTTEETKEEIITSYVIRPQLNNIDLGFAAFIKKNGSEFSIMTRVKLKKKNPTAPEFSTDSYLKAFKIAILKDLVNIDFKEIRFVTTAGKKADVSVEMADKPIYFGGALEFINNFNSLIPSNGFSDPPYLDVTIAGIKCGFTLALPNLQMGAFSLSNMTLGAEVNLPFTGAPLTFGFRFCERQQPFVLTVSFLGGGGFFGLELDLNGLRQIEASLEFGVAASINLGVASGSASIVAGIYFKMVMTDGQNSTTLTGYLRINGCLCILGLITASIELYMAFTYLIDKKKAFGEATLKLKLEILFLSLSVTLHTQRTFAGSGSDPNFQMAIKENEWLEYCSAYAA